MIKEIKNITYEELPEKLKGIEPKIEKLYYCRKY